MGANGQSLGAKREDEYEDLVDLKLKEIMDRYADHNIDVDSINTTLEEDKKKRSGAFGVEGDERFKRQFEELGYNVKLYANTSRSDFTKALGAGSTSVDKMVGKTYVLGSNMVTTPNGRTRSSSDTKIKISAGKTTKAAVSSSGKTAISRGTKVMVTGVSTDRNGRTIVKVKTI